MTTSGIFQFGSGLLVGTRTDGTGPYTPRRFGTLQDVSIEFNGEIKELFGQFQFPVDTARGKTKIAGKAKLATIDVNSYNDLFFGQTVNTGSLSYAYNESATIPATPFQVTVANSADTPLADQGVFFQSDGSQLVAAASASATGIYSFAPSTGIYTFNTADATKAVSINYTYTLTSGHNLAISGQTFMGNTPRFQIVLYHTFENQQLVFRLYSCVSTRLTYPTRIDDYVIQEFDFSSFSNGAGNVGKLSMSV